MKSFVKIALVLGLFIGIYSCQPDDSSSVTPPRAYDEVYNEEIAKIEEFLETHYVTVDGDFNTTFTKIPDGGTQTPVADMPQLDFKEVDLHDITYKIYYLKLREGLGQSPTRVDSTFVGYKGDRLFKGVVDNVPTFTINPFENNPNPIWFTLDRVIRGWAEIIPEFKTGTFGSNPDGTVSYQDFGAGVMFLPSAVAYFNTVRPGIPSYSILMFNFKLYNLQYMDHDRDRILSKDEYGDPTNPNRFKLDAIDTDGDGRVDYLDTDDDGDGRITKSEIQIPSTNPPQYYDFLSIPLCNSTGKKIHLASECR